MTDDVDPENPRPKGHYPRFRDNEWHYIPDVVNRECWLRPNGALFQTAKGTRIRSECYLPVLNIG